MWGAILELLAKPFVAWIEKSESRKYMKEEGELEITKAKVALEVAKYTAEADRLKLSDLSDSDYDKQAQLERRYTFTDELLTFCMVALVGAHFFYPESLALGWEAMGYKGAPWWLEFIIVGVFVSVFGLMRLFRAMSPFRKSKDKES